MMCPPFCLFMPGSLAHCRPPSLAILRVSRSCSKKVSTCPNPPSMRCSGPLASGVELRPGAISCSPFAGKSAFPRATTVGNVNR